MRQRPKKVVPSIGARPVAKSDFGARGARFALERHHGLRRNIHVVDEAQLLGRARGVGAILRRGLRERRTPPPDRFDPGLPEVDQSGFERRAGLRTGAVAREGLLGALAFAHLKEVDVETELVDQEPVK